jgi:hypothetical protein
MADDSEGGFFMGAVDGCGVVINLVAGLFIALVLVQLVFHSWFWVAVAGGIAVWSVSKLAGRRLGESPAKWRGQSAGVEPLSAVVDPARGSSPNASTSQELPPAWAWRTIGGYRRR